jgi:alkylhydroperoxidase family enzyme
MPGGHLDVLLLDAGRAEPDRPGLDLGDLLQPVALAADHRLRVTAQRDPELVQKLLLLQAWRESGALFSDRERAALQWVEALARVAETRALKLYDGNLHDLLNDTGKDAVMADITSWIGRHLP